MMSRHPSPEVGLGRAGQPCPGQGWRHGCGHGLFLVVLVGLGLAGSACATPQIIPLDEAVRTYNEGVRWERFEMAAGHVPPIRRDEFIDRRDQLHEDLRINDYKVVRVRYDKTGGRARVHVKYTWHLDSRGVVHETHTVQSWERHSRQWLLDTERHLRGEPIPGVKARPTSPAKTFEPALEGASRESEPAPEPAAEGASTPTDPLHVPPD